MGAIEDFRDWGDSYAWRDEGDFDEFHKMLTEALTEARYSNPDDLIKIPRGADGKLLKIGSEVYPTRDGYEFRSGEVCGYGMVAGELCVRVVNIKGGYCDDMWCSPSKIRVSELTAHELLRDYVKADKERDVRRMREIAEMLEVRHDEEH